MRKFISYQLVLSDLPRILIAICSLNISSVQIFGIVLLQLFAVVQIVDDNQCLKRTTSVGIMAKQVVKRKDLSVKEKQEILQRYDKLPEMSQRKAAGQLQISQPLLCKILKNRASIEMLAQKNENVIRKRNRTGKDRQVESALKNWFSNIREKDVPINGPLMRQKAEELAKEMGKDDFVATDGWFSRWKKRENIVYGHVPGRRKSADFEAAETWSKMEWPKIIVKYAPENIYNADETLLYFRAMPDYDYMIKRENDRELDSLKEHVTVLCCTNMRGQKRRLLVIGKKTKSLCFKSIKHLPVDYRSSANAWMTTTIFNNWLVKWDMCLKRKIVLLVDNYTAHRSVNASLKNIKIIFFPANTASLIQPCGQGIISNLKAYYRRELHTRILEELDDTESKMNVNDIAKRISFLDALHLLAMSWKQVSKQTIEKCFEKVIFFKMGTETSANKTDFAQEIVDKLPKRASKEESVEEEIIDKPLQGMSKEEFEYWLAIDEEIQMITSGICQAVTKDSEGLADENETVRQEDSVEDPPTNAQMRAALRVLRRGVQHRATEFHKHYEYELFINELLQKKQQTNKTV
ncbi:tigger transposable element-derived protein 4-like [Centruroides vittatus]|uniref:tigger transposable element-derived protein 4-like n=1 Tax=Centruroides vittatus TaxID=120091 RepID=UPI00350F4F75